MPARKIGESCRDSTKRLTLTAKHHVTDGLNHTGVVAGRTRSRPAVHVRMAALMSRILG
jgi:hypothetical protein